MLAYVLNLISSVCFEWQKTIFKTDEVMKVAIFINKNELTVLHEEKARVVIFNIKEEKVVGVENIILEDQKNDSIVNLLHSNSINQIYLSDIDDYSYHKLTAKGIKVKTLESLENDELFRSLALIIS